MGRGTPLQTHQGGEEEKSLALLYCHPGETGLEGMRGMQMQGVASAPSPLRALPGQMPPTLLLRRPWGLGM